MKLIKIFIIVFSIFSFHNIIKADDIRDLQIEGISVGEDALSYFSKEIIDNNKSYYPNSKKIWKSYIELENKSFDLIQLHINDKNNKYEIISISGIIFFEDSFDGIECKKKRNEIVNYVSKILPNTKKSEEEKDKHIDDKTGQSYIVGIYFDFKEDFSEYIKVACTYYSREYSKLLNLDNHLRLALTTSEHHFWLKDEAY